MLSGLPTKNGLLASQTCGRGRFSCTATHPPGACTRCGLRL